MSKDLVTEEEKMAWLRANVDEKLPNIYRVDGFTPNGCGPETWKIGNLVIDSNVTINILGLPIKIDLRVNKLAGLPRMNVAGDLHDWRYWTGGSEIDRLRADEELMSTMRKLIQVKWWSPDTWLDHVRMDVVSTVFFKLVRKFGAAHFNYRSRMEANSATGDYRKADSGSEAC